MKTNGQAKRKSSTSAGKQGWQDVFIHSLGRMPNVSVACEAAHVSRQTAYEERRKRKQFADAWDSALTRGIEVLEAECWRRAAIGNRRGVWMKGPKGKIVKVEDVTEFSDTLAIFLLKAHLPQKYRETFRTEVSGPDGGKIELEHANKRPIDGDAFREVVRELAGFPGKNGDGEQVHPAHANPQAGRVPGDNGD